MAERADAGDFDAAVLGAMGAALRDARTAAGLSMRTLATAAGLSQPFLSQIENGAASPSMLTLYRLASALGLSPGDLLPAPAPSIEEIQVVRRAEGRTMRVAESANSAVGRLLSSGEGRELLVSEYRVEPGEDLGDWFLSDGDLTVYVARGTIDIVLEDRGTWTLSEGDAISHPGSIRNRWQVVGDEPATIVLAFVRARH